MIVVWLLFGFERFLLDWCWATLHSYGCRTIPSVPVCWPCTYCTRGLEESSGHLPAASGLAELGWTVSGWGSQGQASLSLLTIQGGLCSLWSLNTVGGEILTFPADTLTTQGLSSQSV